MVIRVAVAFICVYAVLITLGFYAEANSVLDMLKEHWSLDSL
jgi:hypothetical protein